MASNPSRTVIWLLALMVVAWAGLLAVSAAMDRYIFVMKVMIVPVLFGLAVLTRRLKTFVNDWIVFLSFVVLFDALRGLTFAIITRFNWPVYMGYVIDLERFLFGTATVGKTLQAWLYDPPVIGAFEKFLIVIYGSHFLFFLVFAIFVWYLRNEEFWRCKAGLSLVLGLGVFIYFVVPTVPPWMASELFRVLPPLNLIREGVNYVGFNALEVAFDVNPVAAMPSLHMALPSFCTIAGIYHFGRKGIPLIVYSAIVFFAVIYLGEHYIVDALAGVGVAIVSFWLPYKTRIFDRFAASSQGSPVLEEREGRHGSHQFRRKLLMAILILITCLSAGHLTFELRTAWRPTRSFIERELLGKSDLGNFYLGWLAYGEDNYTEAKRALATALDEMPVELKQMRTQAALQLAHSAFKTKDYASVIEVLERLPSRRLGTFTGVLLGVSLVKSGRLDQGLARLSEIDRRFPEDPEALFWLTWFQYKHDRISAEDVKAVTHKLGRYRVPKARSFVGRLEKMLEKSR